MGDHDFQQEVIDRLARIETNQVATMDTVKEQSKTLIGHGERITAVESSSKSAHHRIDGIFVCAGTLGTFAGGLVSFIASFWPRGGGHG